jgi:hypothetical protein
MRYQQIGLNIKRISAAARRAESPFRIVRMGAEEPLKI